MQNPATQASTDQATTTKRSGSGAHSASQQQQQQQPQQQTETTTEQINKLPENNEKRSKSQNPINYKNGRKLEPAMFSFQNYYHHREKLPQHYNPLLQYLENTEVKYHNDNLFEDSPTGMPTRAQILKERVYHLPVIKDTPAEKARYRRKLEETQRNIAISRKKYDFTTYDQYSSHYFLTGARFNRNDTIDSKILNKYGVFVHRQKPELVYIKSNKKALESFKQDMSAMNSYILNNQERPGFRSKSMQVHPSMLNESRTNAQN